MTKIKIIPNFWIEKAEKNEQGLCFQKTWIFFISGEYKIKCISFYYLHTFLDVPYFGITGLSVKEIENLK